MLTASTSVAGAICDGRTLGSTKIVATRYTQDTRTLAELYGLDLADIAIAMATAKESRLPVGSSGSTCVVKTTSHPSTPPLLIITVEGEQGIETMGWVCPIPEGVDAADAPTSVLAAICERYGDPLELHSDGQAIASGTLIADATFPGRFDAARDLTYPEPKSMPCMIRVLTDDGSTSITLLFHMRVNDLAEALAQGA